MAKTKTVLGLLVMGCFASRANAQFTQLNKSYHVSPIQCAVTATTTAFTAGPALEPPATNNVVLFATANTTAGTIEVTCPLNPPGFQLTTIKGIQVTAVGFYYGVQGLALTASTAAASLATVTYPASTAAGAAAAGTVGTALTIAKVTPTTLQKATTTSGQCYNEKLFLTTPIILSTDNQQLTFDQIFGVGTTATTLEICDIVVYYNEIVASLFPNLRPFVMVLS